jgi:hypothetical protein
MVLSSLSEGGAKVISESVVAGVPILASRMAGNVGLPAYLVGDTEAFARLLRMSANPDAGWAWRALRRASGAHALRRCTARAWRARLSGARAHSASRRA